MTELRSVELDTEDSANNSTAALLAGGASWVGAPDDLTGWSYIIVSVFADVESAFDGLMIEFSPDNVNWYQKAAFTIGAGRYKTFTFNPSDRWLRVSYTNGASPQGQFHISTRLMAGATKPSTSKMQESIDDDDDAELVKAVLTARQDDGSYENVAMDTTKSLNIAFGDGANLDAFSRLRISDPDTVFDSTFQYNLQPLIYEQITSGTGAVVHSPNDASGRLNIGAGAGTAALQSRAYLRYIPGKGQLALMTGNFEQHVAGSVKRSGYFDANDGVFYEQDAAGDLYLVIRSSTSGAPVETRIPQSSWNIDRLDGTGRSAITLDPTKVYILVIEMQWLGMGRVRVGFDIDGRIYMAHQFLNANSLTTVYMKTANLPIRWEASGTAVDTCLATCSSVQSEGGADKFLGYRFSYSSGPRTAPNGSPGLVVGLRPALTFNGQVNRMLIELNNISVLQTSNGIVRFDLLYNPTITGGAWVPGDATYSGAEINVTGTVTGGIVVTSFFSQATNQAKLSLAQEIVTRYPLVLDAAGAQYASWALAATGVGSVETVYGAIDWEEVR